MMMCLYVFILNLCLEALEFPRQFLQKSTHQCICVCMCVCACAHVYVCVSDGVWVLDQCSMCSAAIWGKAGNIFTLICCCS